MGTSFATNLLGWKKLKKTGELVPNSADSDSGASKALAGEILNFLGVTADVIPLDAPENLGPALEQGVSIDLANSLPEKDQHRLWHVDHKKVISDFSQYSHLRKVADAVRANPTLRTDLGIDYLIKPDVTVGISQVLTAQEVKPFLHAAVSCKWTIRSDRVQNIRHEFLQMIRHRRGRLPHLVTVTAEPMPSRIAAIARGTGEVDAVYHIAFDALQAAVAAVGSKQQKDDLAECIGQGRLRPYEELASTLATW
ncbi:NgoMIV family type II restriction endonuclease [Streptomyces sp. NPDC044984]|uniref:NgoMIV family type II restriction endonuclease n=1 Tax=Streptomyces sp. NPDC044984 TaxID=3154335 RepID=UPI00340F1E9A